MLQRFRYPGAAEALHRRRHGAAGAATGLDQDGQGLVYGGFRRHFRHGYEQQRLGEYQDAEIRRSHARRGAVHQPQRPSRCCRQVYQRQGHQQRPSGQHLQVALHLRRHGCHRAQALQRPLPRLPARSGQHEEPVGLCAPRRPLSGQLPHDAFDRRRSVGRHQHGRHAQVLRQLEPRQSAGR